MQRLLMDYKHPMPDDLRDVEDVDAVTAAVLTASRVLIGVAARSLEAARETVTLPQFRLLVVLSSRGPMKLAALAGHLGVNPSTALRMLERLEAAGLAGRRVNPRVRRESIVSLTSRGAAVVDDVTARRREEIASVVARMDPDRRLDLVRALRDFGTAADEPDAGGVAPLGWE